jgi:hypothetical protein
VLSTAQAAVQHCDQELELHAAGPCASCVNGWQSHTNSGAAATIFHQWELVCVAYHNKATTAAVTAVHKRNVTEHHYH